MNFLFINHHANAPEYGNPYRTYYLAKALVRLGHKVTVVAAGYSHLRLKQPPKNPGITREIHEGITYLFLPAIGIGTSLVSRVTSIFGFVWSLTRNRRAIETEAKPDVVVEGTRPIFCRS